MSTLAQKKCRELVADWPDSIGVKDVSGQGVGGIMLEENKACIPTVFCYEWPDGIKADLVSEDNPNGRIMNSDLEMAGILMMRLVMKMSVMSNQEPMRRCSVIISPRCLG